MISWFLRGLCCLIMFSSVLNISAFANMERIRYDREEKVSEEIVDENEIITDTLNESINKVDSKTVPYIFDEIYTVVEVPAEYSTIVRYMSESDPELRRIHIKPKDVNKYMIDNNMFLDSATDDGSIYLIFCCTIDKESAEIFDISSFDEGAFNDIITDFVLHKEEEGISIDKSSIETYDTGRQKFVVMKTYEDEYGYVSMYYYTIDNGMKFEFVLTQDNGVITGEGEEAIKNIASSMRFTKGLTKEEAMGLVKEPSIINRIKLLKRPYFIGVVSVSVGILFAGIAFINRRRIARKMNNDNDFEM